MQQGKKMTGVEQGRQYWGNIKNIYILLQTNNLRKLVQFVSSTETRAHQDLMVCLLYSF